MSMAFAEDSLDQGQPSQPLTLLREAFYEANEFVSDADLQKHSRPVTLGHAMVHKDILDASNQWKGRSDIKPCVAEMMQQARAAFEYSMCCETGHEALIYFGYVVEKAHEIYARKLRESGALPRKGQTDPANIFSSLNNYLSFAHKSLDGYSKLMEYGGSIEGNTIAERAALRWQAAHEGQDYWQQHPGVWDSQGKETARIFLQPYLEQMAANGVFSNYPYELTGWIQMVAGQAAMNDEKAGLTTVQRAQQVGRALRPLLPRIERCKGDPTELLRINRQVKERILGEGIH